MNSRMRQLPWILALFVTLATPAFGQSPVDMRLDGLLNDYTADLDGQGPWHVTGSWSMQVKGASGKGDFSAALGMVRADSPVRQAHTHHVHLANGAVTPIAGGFRVTGAATITGNGNLAGYSGSTIVVDVVGGNTVGLSNVRLTFEDGAVNHFGAEPLDGTVSSVR